LQQKMVRLTSKMNKTNKRANLSKRTPTRRRPYTPSSINKGHVLPFIKVTHPVVSLDEEVPILLVPVGIRGLVH